MNQPVDTSPSNESKGASRKRRAFLFSLLALAVAAASGGGWAYWDMVGSRYVSTDNAYTAAEVASVTAEVAGPVADVRVVNSQAVKRGDILVVIDNTDANIAVNQAQANLARAHAQIAAAKANVERTDIDLMRREALVNSGAVSADALTQAKSAADTAHAALQAARAEEALAEARLTQAKVDLARTVIRAPISGVVARRQVQLGERVQPSTPLLSIVPVRRMYVNANFKETQLADVRPGEKVRLVSDLYGDKVVFHGVVDGFDGGTGAAFALIPAQNATGNWIKVVQRLPVRIRLDPAELQTHPLRVGLSMDATVDLRSQS